MTTSKNLIKLVDENRIAEVANKDALRGLLNKQPTKAWIKQHPFNRDVDYLPIDKVEALLDVIFQDWQVEIKSVSQLAQSVCAVVRLHYRNPVTGEWMFHDGVGATPLRTDKGFSAADMAHIKSDAVATGAPAAVSFAIKDAADHIGKIFGRDLNRKDTVTLPGVYEAAQADAEVEQAKEALQSASNLEALRAVWSELKPRVRTVAEVRALKDERKLALEKETAK